MEDAKRVIGMLPPEKTQGIRKLSAEKHRKKALHITPNVIPLIYRPEMVNSPLQRTFNLIRPPQNGVRE